MKRYAIPLLGSLLLLIALTLPSSAQDVTKLQWLDIRLWPEYDTPQLLVILEGEPVQPGQNVVFPLPPGADIHAVATTSDEGRLVDTPWEQTTTTDGVDLISVTPEGQQFHIEYYIPIAADGNVRQIDFILPANYIAANNAAFEIVLPPTANEVVVEPEATPSDDPASSKHVLLRKVGVVTGEQPLSQSISYSNPSGALTVSEQPSQVETAPPPARDNVSAAPVSTDTPSNRNLVLFGLAGLAVLLIAVGAFGLWRSHSSDDVSTASAHESPSRGKGKRRERKQRSGVGKDRFCRRCGAEFTSGDHFCRKCGEKRL